MNQYLDNIYLKKTNYKIINNREIQENELTEEQTGSFQEFLPQFKSGDVYEVFTQANFSKVLSVEMDSTFAES
jgi:hypothetical protein